MQSLTSIQVYRSVTLSLGDILCISSESIWALIQQLSLEEVGALHRSNKNDTMWNIGRITKMQPRDMKWANAVGKMVPTDLLNPRLPQNFDLWKNTMSVKHNKVKYNKTRDASLWHSGRGRILWNRKGVKICS